MNIKLEKINNLTVVNVKEQKFTNIIAAEFREIFEEAVNNDESKFIINLEKVNYMDSAGLGSIVSSLNYLNDFTEKNGSKGKIVICGLNKNVELLFSMLRINNIFDIYLDL